MKILRFIDQNLEKVLLIIAYSTCAGIVATEVFRRYILHQQAPWSTTVPSYMFIWITWLGCSYAVKARLHLAFGEIRERLPRNAQFVMMQIDNVLFMVLGSFFVYWSYDLVSLHQMLESIVPGTDNLPSWWFYSATPIGWSVLMFRVLQNIFQDFGCLIQGKPITPVGSLSELDE